MRLGLVLDDVFLAHHPPAGHPERSERLEVLLDLPSARHPRTLLVEPGDVSDERLLAVHTPDHLARIRDTAGRERTMLDPDTFASPETWRVARLAAGSAVRLVDLIQAGRVDAGFLAARPPGHHAESSRAMGFCFFNTAAVAAQYARDCGLAERVAVVDFDVHHGNGTQEIFWKRADVLYLSLHQYPFYPGTGSLDEIGEDEGRGYTVNLPIAAGAGDRKYEELFRQRVIPVLREYQPNLLVVSAGYDAHSSDPLGGMELTTAAFRFMVAQLRDLAGDLCAGRSLYVLEGGYDLGALRECVGCTLETLLGDS